MRILFIFFSLVILGCETAEMDKYEILSVALYESVSQYDNHYSKNPPAPQFVYDTLIRLREPYEDSIKRRQELVEYRVFLEKWEQEQKTKTRTILIEAKPKSLTDFLKFNQIKDEEEFKSRFSNSKAGFYKLVADQPVAFEDFDVNRIENFSDYQLASYTKEIEKDTSVVGVAKFTNVSISTDNQSALVGVDWICGGLCGGRELLFLEKQNKEWKVLYNYPMGVY